MIYFYKFAFFTGVQERMMMWSRSWWYVKGQDKRVAEVARLNQRKQLQRLKDEEVKPNTKQISVKDVSVMIKGLSQEELSPRKEIGDDLEMKEETEEKAVEVHVQETETKPKMHKQTARRGVRLHPAKRNLDRKTLREMKRVENIEEPQDSGRSIVLKNDYEVDSSQSSYEEWLKDNNLAGASSDKENPDSDFVIEIDTRNGEIRKKEEVLDVTVCSTLSSSELDKTQEGLNKSEVRKKQKLNETVSSDTFNYTFDDSSHFEESSLFSYSEEDIAEHYANLAASVIACFSAKFKMEERVKCLNKILHLLEQYKEEIIQRKKYKKSCEDKEAKAYWEKTFGVSKREDSVNKEEETVKGQVEAADAKKKEEEEAECKKKKEEEDGFKAEVKAAEAKKKEEEVAECKKKKEEEDGVKAEVKAAEAKKKEEEVAECKKKKEEEDRVKAEVEAAEVKKKEEEVTENDTEGKSRKAVSFSETVAYNTQNVAEENLDDTLEVNDTNEDIEQKVQINFNPPSLEQIEKHVKETIAEIRTIGTAYEKDDGENEDSDSLVIDDQMECTPPCSQMPCNYGKTR